jgi:hypothetical protein
MQFLADRLTLRSDQSPVIVLPSLHNPNYKKQKGTIRPIGHNLEMRYDNCWLGAMAIEYKDNDQIAIDVTTKNTEEL